METIKGLLRDHIGTIQMAKDINAGIVYKMYYILKEYLEKILSYNWMGPDSKLVLVGGIMINCDGEGTDMFLPMDFEIRSDKGETRQNIFDETYGSFSQAK